MNILISAYDCSPIRGSEGANGWNWIYQYGVHQKDKDHIYVVAEKKYAQEMEKGIRECGLKSVTLWLPELPAFFNKLLNFNRITRLIHYAVWEKYAYRFVRQQSISFDIIHHVTKGALWFPGEFWKYDDVYTIFGPVGGGQEVPKALKSYQTMRVEETIRTIANRMRIVLPKYRKAIKSFDAVYAVNKETYELLKRIRNENIYIVPDIATANKFLGLKLDKPHDHRNHRFLFSGRYHIPTKGVMFLFDCLKYLPKEYEYSIDFIGGGGDDRFLLKRVKELNLEDHVSFLGRLPYSELNRVYAQYDAFLFTSLRETGGNVLVEAMASGLPVIGFNTSVNRIYNENNCGIFIEVEGNTLENIKKMFANAMVSIFDDYAFYTENAYSFANKFTWEEKYKRIMNDYERIVK